MTSDLMALAKIRRMLLEQGYAMKPAAAAGADGTVGALEIWLHTPQPEMDGMSPMQTMQTQSGEERVRTAIVRLLSESEPGD